MAIKLLPVHHPCKAWLYPGHPGWVEQRATKPGIEKSYIEVCPLHPFTRHPFCQLCFPPPLIGQRILSYFITVSLGGLSLVTSLNIQSNIFVDKNLMMFMLMLGAIGWLVPTCLVTTWYFVAGTRLVPT